MRDLAVFGKLPVSKWVAERGLIVNDELADPGK
jgi:hypothetical protein